MIVSGQYLCIILLILLFLVNEKKTVLQGLLSKGPSSVSKYTYLQMEGGTVAAYLNLGF